MFEHKTITTPTRLPDEKLDAASAEGWDLLAPPAQVIVGAKAAKPVYEWHYTFRRLKAAEPATVDSGRSVAAASIAHNPRSANVTHGMGGFR